MREEKLPTRFGRREPADRLTTMGTQETERNIANKISHRGFHSGIFYRMLIRNRMSRAATRGCLIAALLTANIVPALGQAENPDQAGPNDQSGAEQIQPQPAAAPMSPSQTKIAPDKYESFCKEPQPTEEADLCQQWRMANAAEKQLDWLRKQYEATWYEIGALVCTLLFTGWASIAASKAARAADKSVEITAKTANRELRAYVSGAPVHIFSINASVETSIEYEMKNHGHTPALNLVNSARVDIFFYPLPPNFSFPPIEFSDVVSEAVIFSQEKLRSTAVAKRIFTPEEIERVTRDKTNERIYIYGEIRYIDAFKEPRVTRFCSSLVGSENTRRLSRGEEIESPGIRFERAAQHNHAT